MNCAKKLCLFSVRIDFIRCILTIDPTERLTASEALRHPWLSDADSVDASFSAASSS